MRDELLGTVEIQRLDAKQVPMKRILLILIILTGLFTGIGVKAQQETSLILSGNQTYVIENSEHILNGFEIGDNSSLIIRNSHITMLESSYNVYGDAKLLIDNSTLAWQGQGGIRMKDQSHAEIANSTIYMKYEVANRTYYAHGIGLSENASIKTEDSMIGYVKLSDSASSKITGSTLGEYGTNSIETCAVTDSEIQSLVLIYEDTWIHFNGSIIGKVNWTSDKIVKNGNNSHPLILENVTLSAPPSYQLMNCNFEANNTEVDLVIIGGNSGVNIRGVNGTLLYLIEDVWATVKKCNLDILRCRNGDFNVKVSGSELEVCESMMTTGFNLRMEDTDIGKLNLMYAHPEAPNNVEILNCCVQTLFISPSAPPVFMFDDSTVERGISLESGEGVDAFPLLTGSLSFGNNCTIEYDEREGVSELVRIFRFEVTSENTTTSNMPYTVMNGNSTIKTGVTGDMGIIVFPLKFQRQFSLIEDPEPGGPYLNDFDNFTSPLRLIIHGQETELGFTSDTPIKIKIISTEPPSTNLEPNTAITPVSIITSLMIIGVVISIISRRKTVSTSHEEKEREFSS